MASRMVSLARAHLQGPDPLKKSDTLKVLDDITDVVLAYRPEPKSRPAKKRRRAAKELRKTKSDQNKRDRG
jgi:hypothetical protein